jgi:hypothetical protein
MANTFYPANSLYRLSPTLLQEPVTNDSIKRKLTSLRENFKLINRYVCENDRVYPGDADILKEEKKLLLDYKAPESRHIFSMLSDTALMPDFVIPPGYRFIYAEIEGEALLPGNKTDFHPTFRLSLIETKPRERNYLYWSKRDIATLSRNDSSTGQWKTVSENDRFSLGDFRSIHDLKFEWAIYTDSVPINLSLRHMNLRLYGIR